MVSRASGLDRSLSEESGLSFSIANLFRQAHLSQRPGNGPRPRYQPGLVRNVKHLEGKTSGNEKEEKVMDTDG